MRVLVLLYLTGPLWAQPLDWRPVLRTSLDRMLESDLRLADYSFDRVITRKEFESDGRLKLETVTLTRPERVDGVWILRVISRNGRPLSQAESSRQEDSIRRRLAEAKVGKAGSTSIMGRETEDLIREFPEALDYRLVGEDTQDGRKLWVLACEPRPGYKPPSLRARLLEKARGKVWIDQADKDLVRVEAEVFDTISLGFGILGRVDKGTRFALRRARSTEGQYFTRGSQVKFAAKVLLFKSLSTDISTLYVGFRLKTAVQSNR